MIIYGAASGQPEALNTAALAPAGSLYVQRPTLQTYTRTPELLRERARQLFELIESGGLDVRIGAHYALEHARQAQEDLEARGNDRQATADSVGTSSARSRTARRSSRARLRRRLVAAARSSP